MSTLVEVSAVRRFLSHTVAVKRTAHVVSHCIGDGARICDHAFHKIRCEEILEKMKMFLSWERVASLWKAYIAFAP